MALELILYKNSSSKTVVDKKITELHHLGAETSIRFKGDVDIVNPVFILSANIGGGDTYDTVLQIKDWNYCYCPQLKRYYYAKPVFSNGVIRLECKCDVLMSFKSSIKNSVQWISRQEFKENKGIPDNMLVFQSEPEFWNKPFGKVFNPDADMFIVQMAEG